MATSKKTRPAAAAVAPIPTPAVATSPAVISKIDDQPASEPLFREDRIRLAAYRLSLTRELGQADPLADWLEAEAEIDAEDAS